MREQNQTAQIIINKRKSGYYSAFNECEIPFVSKCQGLSDGEKLIWINLAARTTMDANLSCRASLNQIAAMVGKKANTIYKSIKNLVSLGFLKSELDKEKRINIYYVLLPEDGLEALENAPNRGEKQCAAEPKEAVNSDDSNNNVVQFKATEPNSDKNQPLKNIRGDIGNISDPPLEKNHTLYIKNINNIKKHNIHNNTKIENCNVQNADALILKFQREVEEVKRNNPSISLCKANLIAHQAFSEAERDQIHLALIEKSQREEMKKHKQQLESDAFKKKLENSTPVPKTRAGSTNSSLVEMTFDGEHFLIEEEVKNQILGNIPKLYHSGKIKGEAASKPLKVLLKEILYYVAKAGSIATKPVCQLKRYFIARKICINGSWERPIGLAKDEIVARERKWQAEKRKEYETAKRYAGINGFA